ncbi:hypothetical protein T4D_8193 [Trichinella pseudospiralis]|uniref:Uncharacterized protein n=1 Tax=Trichinella pseudospiralis TaxID=6337 RepID=A0A0V1F3L7_TRIPS|nr:hypothetical protein T4D_8193 [Trichinella pseudospiralis]
MLKENESALVWFGILAMSLALGYVIYKAIMMRKKEQRDTNLLKEYLGKFPDEPAPPRSHGPVEKGQADRRRHETDRGRHEAELWNEDIRYMRFPKGPNSVSLG